jgi:hypothetical protein
MASRHPIVARSKRPKVRTIRSGIERPRRRSSTVPTVRPIPTWSTMIDVMARRRSPRRFAAILALTGWIGFAGGGDAAAFLAQTLGFHGDCRMPCCRGRMEAACPRLSAAASDASVRGHSHHSQSGGRAVAASDASAPSASLSISSGSSCAERCALLSGLHRSALTAERIASPTPPTPITTCPPVAVDRTTSRFLGNVSSRAPPA